MSDLTDNEQRLLEQYHTIQEIREGKRGLVGAKSVPVGPAARGSAPTSPTGGGGQKLPSKIRLKSSKQPTSSIPSSPAAPKSPASSIPPPVGEVRAPTAAAAAEEEGAAAAAAAAPTSLATAKDQTAIKAQLAALLRQRQQQQHQEHQQHQEQGEQSQQQQVATATTAADSAVHPAVSPLKPHKAPSRTKVVMPPVIQQPAQQQQPPLMRNSKPAGPMDINYDDVSSPEYELNYDDVSEPEYEAGVSFSSGAARAQHQPSPAAGSYGAAGAPASPDDLDQQGQLQGRANLPALLTVPGLATPELCDSRQRSRSPIGDAAHAAAATAGAARRRSRSRSPPVRSQQQQQQQQQRRDLCSSRRRSLHYRSTSPANDHNQRYSRGENPQHPINSRSRSERESLGGTSRQRSTERSKSRARSRTRSRSRSRYCSRSHRRGSPDYTAGSQPSSALPQQESGRSVDQHTFSSRRQPGCSRQEQGRRHSKQDKTKTTLFVGDLPPSGFSSADLQAMCETAGFRVRARVQCDRSGACAGYGFVECDCREDAAAVLFLVESRDPRFSVEGSGFIRASYAHGSLPDWKRGPAAPATSVGGRNSAYTSAARRSRGDDMLQALEEAYENTAWFIPMHAATALAGTLGGVPGSGAACLDGVGKQPLIDYGDL